MNHILKKVEYQETSDTSIWELTIYNDKTNKIKLKKVVHFK